MTDRAFVRRQKSIESPAAPPAVLFVDDGDWDSFLQLAGVLRSSGIRTIRATTIAPGRAVQAFHALFDHTVLLRSDADWERLRGIVGRYTIIDVQVTEAVAGPTYAFLATVDTAARRQRWLPRAAMIDKLRIATTLGQAGIKVPATIGTTDASAAEQVRQWGLPVVVKDRVGSAGRGVQVVRTAEELAAVEAHPDRFYEQFITGTPVRFGCLATEDGVRLSATWSVLRRSEPLAPATAIEFVSDPTAAQIGRAVVEVTGMRGFLNLQFLRDADGNYWLHDVNPRAWGSFGAFAAVGVDLGRTYIDWLCGRAVPRIHIEPGTTAKVKIFPGALRVPGPGSERLSIQARWLLQQRRSFGTSYLLVELVRNREYVLKRSTRTGFVPQAVATTEPLLVD